MPTLPTACTVQPVIAFLPQSSSQELFAMKHQTSLHRPICVHVALTGNSARMALRQAQVIARCGTGNVHSLYNRTISDGHGCRSRRAAAALADIRVTSPLNMGPIFFMACRLGICTFGFARSAVTRVGDAGMTLRCDWTWLDAGFCRDAS